MSCQFRRTQKAKKHGNKLLCFQLNRGVNVEQAMLERSAKYFRAWVQNLLPNKYFTSRKLRKSKIDNIWCYCIWTFIWMMPRHLALSILAWKKSVLAPICGRGRDVRQSVFGCRPEPTLKWFNLRQRWRFLYWSKTRCVEMSVYNQVATSYEFWLVMYCQIRVLIGWLEIWARISKIFFGQEIYKQYFSSFVELF